MDSGDSDRLSISVIMLTPTDEGGSDSWVCTSLCTSGMGRCGIGIGSIPTITKYLPSSCLF
jgi:hypothetical protein